MHALVFRGDYRVICFWISFKQITSLPTIKGFSIFPFGTAAIEETETKNSIAAIEVFFILIFLIEGQYLILHQYQHCMCRSIVYF